MPYNKEYAAQHYQNNKDALREKRKARYDSDPEVRKRLAAAASEYRKRVKPKKPEEAQFSVEQLCENLDISLWSFREWRRKGYFPRPYSFGGRFWFTAGQVQLIAKLRDFLGSSRNVASRVGEFEDLTNLIAVNWNPIA